MGEKHSSVWDAIYEDDPAEKALCEAKSKLMNEVEGYINRNKLTQQQAAEQMGVTQPRISNVKNGQISKFTIDALTEMLARVGVETEIRFREKGFIQNSNETGSWPGFKVLSGKKKRRGLIHRHLNFSTSIHELKEANETSYEYTNRA